MHDRDATANATVLFPWWFSARLCNTEKDTWIISSNQSPINSGVLSPDPVPVPPDGHGSSRRSVPDPSSRAPVDALSPRRGVPAAEVESQASRVRF